MGYKLKVGIEAIAYSLGTKIVTNEKLQTENPHWDMDKTFERTGVSSRPIAAAGITALDMGHEASNKVLRQLDINAGEVDALIFCTQTPDYVLPPNSTLLHGRLDMSSGTMAFDISHACSGFMYSLGIARSLIGSGTARRVLIITADTYSRLVHPLDRATRPLFGDGAAAAIVSAHNPRLAVLDMSFGTSGKDADRFIIRNGGARHKGTADDHGVMPDKSGRINSPDHIYMNGMGVLSFFNHTVPVAVLDMLDKHNKSINDISFFVFHQASKLALDGIARSLKIPASKMLIDMADTGNLVSASIPVVLANRMDNNSFKQDQLVVLCGFGVGLSWSTALVQF